MKLVVHNTQWNKRKHKKAAKMKKAINIGAKVREHLNGYAK